MNKLAAVQKAVEEVNKQAMFGSVLRAGKAAYTGVKNFFKAPKITPPVASAGGAAVSAQKAAKPGLIRRAAPTAGFIAAPFVLKGGNSSNLSGQY